MYKSPLIFALSFLLAGQLAAQSLPGTFDGKWFDAENPFSTVESVPGTDMIFLPEGSAKALMQEIAHKHAGKMVYLDVWATWCAPCHQELKGSGPMKQAFERADIAVVYLCADGEEEQMEYAIKKYDLSGDHYFLSKRSSPELRDEFKISGYPTYLIMNKNGQVVNKKAPRPSDLNALMREMERLND